MARVNSTMLELGTTAPAFDLPEPATGNQVKLADFSDAPLLVVFACNHCPFVLHIIEQFAAFAREYHDRGLQVVMINSNDVDNYPDDSPDKMVELARRYDFSFPYLYDESQQAAAAYQAACTPDLYLFDDEHRLVYRGQFDDARPGNDAPVTGADLRRAVDQLLNKEEIGSDQKPSLGCNIKWKPGNEPDYFSI